MNGLIYLLIFARIITNSRKASLADDSQLTEGDVDMELDRLIHPFEDADSYASFAMWAG